MSALDIINDLKVNYGEEDSPSFTTLLNADHARIKSAFAALGIPNGGSGAGSAGGSMAGVGRLCGANFAEGRMIPDPGDLYVRVPNATYQTATGGVVIDEEIGFALVPVAPGANHFLFLSRSESGAAQWTFRAPLGDGRAKPASFSALQNDELAGAACLGRVQSDAGTVTLCVYTYTDELVSGEVLLQLLRSILESAGGESGPAIFGNQIPVSPQNPQNLVSYIDEINAAQDIRIDEIAGPSEGSAANTDRFLKRDVARLEEIAARANAGDSLFMDASVVVAGVAGNGEFLGVDEFGDDVRAKDVHSGNTTLDAVRNEER